MFATYWVQDPSGTWIDKSFRRIVSMDETGEILANYEIDRPMNLVEVALEGKSTYSRDVDGNVFHLTPAK